jgi:Domain of unknown function (DUF6487)
VSQVQVACPKCRAEMTAGFVPDHSHGVILQGHWYEGGFETKWLGTRLRNEGGGLPITTYRCASCGYLEAFAKP